jgi:Flp pilus assembly protein TadG
MSTHREHGQCHRLPARPGQRGQSLTEFALTMPLLLALLVGIVMLAWVGFSYVSITSAARMGARHMVSNPIEPDEPDRFASADAEITYVVTSSMPFLNWQEAQITILPQPPTSRVVVNPNNPNEPNYMSVQILYPVDLPTVRIPYVLSEGSFVLMQPISLQATARMRLD